MNALRRLWHWLRIKISANRYRFSVLGCALIAAMLTTPFFVMDVQSHSYHVDEDNWIYSSYYYRLFFKDHNLTSPDWNRRDVKFNGTVGKFALGFGIMDVAKLDFKPTPAEMDSWWPANQHMPEKSPRLHPRILHAGRMTCAAMGAAAAFFLFFIGYSVAGRLAGIFTSLFFACHPLVLSICRHAMLDAPMIFFVTAAVAIHTFLMRRLRNPRRHIFSIALLSALESVAIGCAVGTKMNGALVSIGFTFAMLITSIAFAVHNCPGSVTEPRRWWKRLLGALGILWLAAFIGAASFGVYVYLNPLLHTAPIAGVRELYAITTADLEQTLKMFPNDRLNSLPEKVDYVWREVFLGRDMFLPQPLSRWVNGALSVIGALLLTWKVGATLWRRRPAGELAAWTWIAVSTAGVIVWIPVHWDRYLIPALACGSILSGIGLAGVLKGGFALASRVVGLRVPENEPRHSYLVTAAAVLASLLASVGLWQLQSASAIAPVEAKLAVGELSIDAPQSKQAAPAEAPLPPAPGVIVRPAVSKPAPKFILPSSPPPTLGQPGEERR
jgi:hypothetical protein